MKTFKFRKTPLYRIFGLVTLAIPILTATPSSAQLQLAKLVPVKAAPPVPAIPVTVTNTPLPVTISSPVTVANPLTLSGPITVGNPGTNPVQARDVDNPANEPFEFVLCSSNGSGLSLCIPFSETLPTTTASGKTVKRFVAEYVSGTCDTIPDTNITRISIIHGFPDGGTGLGHYFVPVSVPGPPGFGNYDFAQQTRIYGNPGDRMILGLSYWGSGNYSCLMYVSGYLVTQ